MEIIRVILNQNYFQYNDKYFKTKEGIAMGSPNSITIAEMYLQTFEELIVEYWKATGEIIYYRRYVDNMIFIPDQN